MTKLGPVGTPEIEDLKDAILNDHSMPFHESVSAGAHFAFLASSGHGGGIRPDMAGPAIICTAWQLECLKDPAPSLARLIAALPGALKNARQALARRKARATAVASLTGLLLPPNTVLELPPWGRLRSARPDDHPGITKLLQQPLPALCLETGEEITITDTGDVILEVDVPFRFSNAKPAPPDEQRTLVDL